MPDPSWEAEAQKLKAMSEKFASLVPIVVSAAHEIMKQTELVAALMRTQAPEKYEKAKPGLFELRKSAIVLFGLGEKSDD